MAKTATVTLGGVDYTVHPFNLDELQEIQDILLDEAPGARNKATFKIVILGLLRADPKVEKPGSIEATLEECRTARDIMMGLASPNAIAAPQAAS